MGLAQPPFSAKVVNATVDMIDKFAKSEEQALAILGEVIRKLNRVQKQMKRELSDS